MSTAAGRPERLIAATALTVARISSLPNSPQPSGTNMPAVSGVAP